ncbi:MAG: arylsulfatase [Thermoanaerobaculia bacterium]
MRAAAVLLVACGALACAPARPNIVFILADDLGWGDLACYGNRRIRTPRLDDLAAEGMRFTHFYAGSAICAPSRCALMTGRDSGHCTVRDNLAQGAGAREQRLVPLAPTDVTVATLLRQAGYATALVGKWGLGDVGSSGAPDRQGFDASVGFLDQREAWDHFPDQLVRDGQRVGVEGNEGLRSTVYAPDLFVDEAIAFARRHRDRPFFLYLAQTLPHPPLRVPSLEPYTETDWPGAYQTYAAMVTRLDAGVGRLLDALAELGLDRRTVVFFSSDNGANGFLRDFFGSTGGLRGAKSDLYEGGIRVPMLVRWTGRVPPGGISDFAWTHADFLPTALELARLEVPAGLALDGRSVAPTLLGRGQPPAPFLYWEFHQPFQQAARWGNWKALRYGTEEPLELYDLANDAAESRDLATDHPEVARQIEALLAQARTETPYWSARSHRWRPRGPAGR